MLHQVLPSKSIELEPLNDPGHVSGFQSAAVDYSEDRLNIIHKLVNDPLSTFYFESDTDDMVLFGIKKGTLLVVDRSIKAGGGMLVIAWQDQTWMVRQLVNMGSKKCLITGQEFDQPIDVTNGTLIWGVVTWTCTSQLEIKKR
jgi:DNA polymerase V